MSAVRVKAFVNLYAAIGTLEKYIELDPEAKNIAEKHNLVIRFQVKDGPDGVLHKGLAGRGMGRSGFFAGDRQLQIGQDLFDVFPDHGLGRRVPQQIRRVEGRHDGAEDLTVGVAATEVLKLAADARNGLLCFQQRLGGRGPQGDDDLRLDDPQLLKQRGRAGDDFLRLGRAVLRRTALQHVADVDLLTRDAHALGEDVGQQLAGASDEGSAGLVFLKAGGFTHENNLGVGVALAKNQHRPRGPQRTGGAACQVGFQGVELGLARSGGGRRSDRRCGDR